MTKPPEKSKPVRKLRCAVYTRKSSEEGLEQEFNSLHAQREACESYIASQRSEGWVLVRDQYDDGGISGGTLERPDLQRLLEDAGYEVSEGRRGADPRRIAQSIAQFRTSARRWHCQPRPRPCSAANSPAPSCRACLCWCRS